MTFPNLIDYKQAIGNASARLATLDAVPVADPTGAPHFVAGNFAGVFKMQKADGSLVALRHLVFQPDDHARYHNGENLLFRRDDFLNPAGSELFKRVAESPDLFVRDWAGGLAKCCAGRAVGIPGVKAALKAAVKLEAAPEQPGMKWFFYRRLA